MRFTKESDERPRGDEPATDYPVVLTEDPSEGPAVYVPAEITEAAYSASQLFTHEWRLRKVETAFGHLAVCVSAADATLSGRAADRFPARDRAQPGDALWLRLRGVRLFGGRPQRTVTAGVRELERLRDAGTVADAGRVPTVRAG